MDNPSGFSSTNYNTMPTFLSQRITRLLAGPEILYTKPSVNLNITDVSQLQPVTVVFSKPMIPAEADNTDNYSVTGEGAVSLTVNSVSYSGDNAVRNVGTVNMGGTLLPGGVSFVISPAVTDMDGNSLADGSIDYNDGSSASTPPKVINVVKNPHAV